MHTITFVHVSSIKWPSSGSTDTFCEHGEQNACPDVNVRLKSSLLDVTWQVELLCNIRVQHAAYKMLSVLPEDGLTDG